jgi:hypothetical protein
MSRADDLLNSVQKAVGDRPLQLLVGVGDLVSEKLRELPDAVTTWQEENRDFPMRAAGMLIGSAFRANLRVGDLYDDLTRRGQDVMTKMRGDEVVAEEDEPFVHEPFMPEPVRRLDTNGARTSTRAAPSKSAAASKKASHAKRAEASMTSSTRAAGAKTAKKAAKKASTKNAAPRKAAPRKAAPRKAVPTKAVPRKVAAKAGGNRATSA